MGLVFFSMCCLATKQENEICCEKKSSQGFYSKEKKMDWELDGKSRICHGRLMNRVPV